MQSEEQIWHRLTKAVTSLKSHVRGSPEYQAIEAQVETLKWVLNLVDDISPPIDPENYM